MSSAGAGSSAKKSKTYHFHSEWEEDYFFTMNNLKCVCLICHVSPALAKKGNLERHFKSFHKKYDSDFPPKSELRKRKIRELKAQFSSQQALFTRATSKSKAATIASFRVSRVLSKHKKPFQDGEIFKEAFLEAADSLFENFKNKSEIMSAIKEVQLSRNTVMRRCEFMAENLGEQLNKDIGECVFFSLQFDETTDVMDTSQLCIFIRMVFKDLSTKEELLKVLPLKGKTRGEDIFHTFSDFVNKTQLPVNKLVSMTTDGAPAMTGRTNGFIALCRGDERFPDFFNYHCIIHQQALCGKMLNMAEVMDISFKIVNSIRARSLQRRLFRSQLQESEAEHIDLLLHTDVRWLSRGKFLQRFRDLLPEIKEFLASKDRPSHQPHIDTEEWLLDLAFLVDITGMLNELNLDLQGKDKTIVDMISAVTAFKQKLKLVSSQLHQRVLRNFRNMMSELENQGKQCDQFNSGRYTEQVQNLVSDFDRRFQDIAAMEPVATYMCFPFGKDTNVEDIASRMATLFNMDTSEVENEILKLQNDIQIKSMATGGSFWNLLSEEKYPNVRKCSMYLTVFFGSTYLCESTFSHLKYIKSKYRSTLSDEHLDACLKLAITNYSPNYTKLADSMQCQSSH